MPIKDENKALYPGGSPTSPEWQKLRAEILERDEHKCKFCKAPNHQWISRSAREAGVYMLANGKAYDVHGARIEEVRRSDFDWSKLVQVILTIMHLDHDPGHNDPENLAAGCQRCHNLYDAPHRKANALETRRSRRAARDLFDRAE